MLPLHGHLAHQMAVFLFYRKINFSGRKDVSIASKPSKMRLPNPFQNSCVIVFLLLSVSHFIFSIRVAEGELITWIKVCLTITEGNYDI